MLLSKKSKEVFEFKERQAGWGERRPECIGKGFGLISCDLVP
jgi:hypothetical protein